MRCPPCSGSCNQGRTCPQFHTHEGLAVVNKGTGLHMPDETHDLPILMYDEPAVTQEGVYDWISSGVRLFFILAPWFALGGLIAGIYVAGWVIP